MVGQSLGQDTYEVAINDDSVDTYTCTSGTVTIPINANTNTNGYFDFPYWEATETLHDPITADTTYALTVSQIDGSGQESNAGTMGGPTGSFYVVTGLAPSSTFTVSFTNVTGGGGMEVYSTSDFATTQECNSNGTANKPECCQADSNPSGILYIKGIVTGMSGGGTTYDIRVQ